MTALDRLRNVWRDQGLAWKDEAADKASAQAPGHSPADRSITFRQIAGQVLMNSHADDKAAVLDAAGLTMRDLFDDATGTAYGYSDGRTVYRTYDDNGKKKFRQSGNTSGTTLYRAEKLAEHQAGVPVYVVEGEKDVHALEAVGVVAACPAMGAGKAARFDWSPLFGHTVVIVADKDNPGRRHAADIAGILDGKAEFVIVEAAAGKDAADHIAAGHGVDEFVPAEVDGVRTPRQLKVTLGSQVVTKRIHWLMPDWIPTGSLTLLAGREGLGKSTIAASLCAQITNGSLEGELYGTPKNVLYVHTEDAREFTVAPRLKAAGADMDRVLFVDVQTDMTETGTLILPLDTPALEAVIRQHEVAFVVLDAATSSMSSDLSGKDDRAVRQYLEPLAQLAARRECVVLGLCHFGKRDGADTGKLILGSIAWSQVARSVLSVAKDEDSGNLVVTNTKGNLAPRVRSMEAAIISATIPTEDGDAEVGVLQWLGESTRDARDLLAGEGDTDADERDEITAVVQDYLMECGGSAPAADVLKVTRAAGLNDTAVKKARRRAGVRTEKAGFGKGWVWTIEASQGSAATQDSAEGTEDSHSRERESSESSRESSEGSRGREVMPPLMLAPAAEGSLVGHVTQAADNRTPVKAPERRCPECGESVPAGKVRHPECMRRHQGDDAA